MISETFRNGLGGDSGATMATEYRVRDRWLRASGFDAGMEAERGMARSEAYL